MTAIRKHDVANTYYLINISALYTHASTTIDDGGRVGFLIRHERCSIERGPPNHSTSIPNALVIMIVIVIRTVSCTRRRPSIYIILVTL